MKYSRYISELNRRENWGEIVQRNKEMHKKKYPNLRDEIDSVYDNYVLNKKVLPSMRSMQFAGKPVEISPVRIYNCSYLPIDDWRAFPEIMFLLLEGTGTGFSVQNHHIEKLPEIKKPVKKRRFLIGDSIEGWSDAVKVLVKSYFTGTAYPMFDFSDIRAKGTPLKTSGGIAPGSEPLKNCLHNIQKILDRKNDGDKLLPIDAHDIVCFIADAVLAGGIRRSSCISLFSLTDQDMLYSKSNSWWELNPQRALANNSVVLLRHRIRRKVFFELWEKVKNNRSGEPGIFFTNDKEVLCNPCAEVSITNNQFCNLTDINASDVFEQKDFENRAKAASFIATLQAGYTNFHYLREIWEKNTKKDALIGVGITGLANKEFLKLDFASAAKVVLEENERVSKSINIKKASRTTVIKPSGTTSLVLGCSSGVHPWHSEYYIRRIRVLKNEPIYFYLKEKLPMLLEDDFYKPHIQAVLSIPQKAPEDAITRKESVIEFLERIKKLNIEWIRAGHRSGDNFNNVSATVSIKEDEWDKVGQWMWENKEFYNGLATLPFDDHEYKQAPFEECSEEKYEKMMSYVKNIDLTEIVEYSDETKRQLEASCSSGKCDLV